MARHIFRCHNCGTYTMNQTCSCNGPAITTRPPKYSPDDRFAEYRRKAKELEGQK